MGSFRKVVAGFIALAAGLSCMAEPVEIPITSGHTDVELTKGTAILVTVVVEDMDLRIVGDDCLNVILDIEKFEYDGRGHRKPHIFLDEDEKLLSVYLGRHVEGKRLTLTVPREVSVKARGQDSSAEIEFIDGEIEINTVDGDIVLKGLKGGIVANTVDGDISIQMSNTGMKNPISLATVDGEVFVETQVEIDADLFASSIDGALKTELPIQVKVGGFRSNWGGVNVQTKLGKGGALLSLRTIDGDIVIKGGKAAEQTAAEAED
ncbi:DUF4097 family beta strand repeat-containing protein [Pelagicoccus sp. SDUM812002]|uniref:DUF4097 family beta strand repeat-containing protein n=1 Tax=Pelagicoccus sp. SDUM812002 TaxID=3041266 RepID=UPI00280E7E75|nr:DUF4097 family beta strand repeat-containing protein [Pelagicoccus sp. SDUM812002]MDQ8188117.1 DUF4097 family beta strand repeat-containing protein [Pelagicoccus sp. SDUM812002]